MAETFGSVGPTGTDPAPEEEEPAKYHESLSSVYSGAESDVCLQLGKLKSGRDVLLGRPKGNLAPEEEEHARLPWVNSALTEDELRVRV